MKRITGAASAALVVLAGLTGCSGISAGSAIPSNATPTPTDNASAETEPIIMPTPTPETTSPKDVIAACHIMVGGDSGDDGVIFVAPDLLNSIGSDMTDDQIYQMLDLNDQIVEATTMAPPELASYITEFGVPFAQLAEVMDDGGGEVHMDTSHVKDSVTDIMSSCADAGYDINQQ